MIKKLAIVVILMGFNYLSCSELEEIHIGAAREHQRRKAVVFDQPLSFPKQQVQASKECQVCLINNCYQVTTPPSKTKSIALKKLSANQDAPIPGMITSKS